jgi:hypothetical protein
MNHSDLDNDRFTDIVQQASAVLDAVSLKTYPGTQPTAAVDEQIAQVCTLFQTVTAKQREVIRWALTAHQRQVLGRYGHRAAMLAIREQSAARLRNGLGAVALATTADDDDRDVMVGVALHYHAAVQLGLRPAEVFDQAASYADPSVAELFRTFGARDDVTLAAFGWQEIATEHGPAFIPSNY